MGICLGKTPRNHPVDTNGQVLWSSGGNQQGVIIPPNAVQREVQREVPPGVNVDQVQIETSGHVSRPAPLNQVQIATSGHVSKPAPSDASTKRLLVVAVDFGTTYTGYAFSFRHEYERDRLKISTTMWSHDHGMSVKAPTAVLLDPNGELISFGYDALSKYAELAEKGNHVDYFFFHRFKMNLYTEEKLSAATSLTDAVGKKMPALVVFSRVLAFLQQDVLLRLHSMDSAMGIEDNSIHWVITVPAIWNDRSKQFMRRAAREIGIQDRQLTLALEPEAASLFCMYIPVRQQIVPGQTHQSETFTTFKRDTKYMILDLGGGTVDITIHAVQDSGLQEVCQPSGGYWGGSTVDFEFHTILTQLLGQQVYDRINKEYAHDMLEFLADFETKKRTFKPEQSSPVLLKIPAAFVDVYSEVHGKSLAEGIAMSAMKDKLSTKRDKLVISNELFESFFQPSLSRIIGHLIQLIENGPANGIDSMLLVGGYSDSEVVRTQISSVFPTIRVIKPDDASLAVLKGAVLFGHNPKAISSRICKKTYGIGMQTAFNPEKHPVSKRLKIGDSYACDDIFDVHLKIGEKVKVDEERQAKSYFVSKGSKYAVLDVYTSTEECPAFVTDKSCAKLGSAIIDLDDDTVDGDMVDVTLIYCGTELGVLACEKRTRKVTSAHFDFLG